VTFVISDVKDRQSIYLVCMLLPFFRLNACRDIRVLEQWAVGTMDCRVNGIVGYWWVTPFNLSINLHFIGIMLSYSIVICFF
jgi:hypothetical protein